MSEQDKTRRRRRTGGETPDTQPHRIVVSEDQEPDWMVSADEVSGAAQRRTGREAPPAQMRSGRATGESREILSMRRQNQEAPAKEQAKPRAGSEAPASPRKPAQRVTPARKAPPRKMTKKQRQRRARNIRRAIAALLGAVVLIAVIVLGAIKVGQLMDIKRTLDQGDGVFYPNIYVNGIHLGGMTLDQAASVVTAQVSAQVADWTITLRAEDGRTWVITGKDLNMKYDVADQLDQLWAIGHTGSSQTRYEQVKALEDQPIYRHTTLSYDLSMVTQILVQIKSEVDRSPVSATRVPDESRWPPFSYTDDIPGVSLDITGTNEVICGMVDRLESGTVLLSPSPVQAPVTREQLEGQIVLLARFETPIAEAGQYAEARRENIRIGTEKFDHLIIRSGESVSFNKVAGKRSDPKNGYQPALEIAYGEYVEGKGGGICQVSSTLYNAVVAAGLTITKRTQHSLPSNYVDMGLDATVSDDRLDFVFKNSTSSDIYIDTDFYEKKGYFYCCFSIYGRPDPNGYTYKLVSEVTQTLPVPDPVYREDTSAKYVIYNDEMHQTSKGAEGYVVDVYLVTLDANGLEVSREYRYTDTYKAQAPVFYVGVQPRPTPVPNGYVD